MWGITLNMFVVANYHIYYNLSILLQIILQVDLDVY